MFIVKVIEVLPPDDNTKYGKNEDIYVQVFSTLDVQAIIKAANGLE